MTLSFNVARSEATQTCIRLVCTHLLAVVELLVLPPMRDLLEVPALHHFLVEEEATVVVFGA